MSNGDRQVTPSSPRSVPEPIAIVGIGCRFPGGADSPETFWQNLCNEVDSVTEVPVDRWNPGSFYDPDAEAAGKTSSKWMGVIDRLDLFDFGFFGISPREAASMDPQQRIMLETAYEAIEDGGQTLEQLREYRTGVYVGVSASDYASIQGSLADPTTIETYTNSGGALSIVSNRISYCFDFSGPSLSIDTACSSAMNAIILACHSIWRGDSLAALAGGVNIALNPTSYIGFTKLSMLSPDGRCKAFDAAGNGYVRSEGAGIILLKPLSRAIADGDRVYATIRGVSANQDGHTSAMVVPGEDAQAAMIQAACEHAGISPADIQFVEAHGTGTVVGDQIEATALGRVLGKDKNRLSPVVLGSVKSNIGHTESAAGVAGVIKSALAIYNGKIPANLHFRTPNPHIDFEGLKLRVPVKLESWPDCNGKPRLVCVNSFGFGGANAHVVLGSVGNIDPVSVMKYGSASENGTQTNHKAANGQSVPGHLDESAWRLFPVTARSAAAVRERAAQLRDFAQPSRDGSEVDLDALGFNLATRQTHHEFRAGVIADSRERLITELDRLAEESRSQTDIGTAEPGGKLAFVFSGQGPQWWAMARQLITARGPFRDVILECDRLMQQYSDWSLWNELTASEANSRMNETAISQPAIFAIQVALAALLESRGISPDVVTGHSVGEIAAAHVAGIYDLATALRIIFHRGRCMDRASSRGGMLAAGMSDDEARRLIAPWKELVCVASINSPNSVTLSGERESLEEINAQLGNDVFHKFLQVEYAFHSSQMDPVRDELLESLTGVCGTSARIPMLSTVTGEWVEGTGMDGGYWWDNVRNPVRFSDAIARLREFGATRFVELSAHPVLRSFVSEAMPATGERVQVISTLRRHEDDGEQVMKCLAELFSHGFQLDWSRFFPAPQPLLKLPPYPWQHERCWSENEGIRQLRMGIHVHPFLGQRLSSAEPVWQVELNPERHRNVYDHVIQNQALFPAAGFIEIGFAVAREIFGNACCILEEVDLHRAAFMPASGKYRLKLQTVFDSQNSRYRVFGRVGPEDTAWILFASGTIVPEYPDVTDYSLPLFPSHPDDGVELSSETFYKQLADSSYHYGPAFRCVEKCWTHEPACARALLRAPELIQPELSQFHCHPGMLDSGIQILSQALVPGSGKLSGLAVPVHIDRIISYQPFAETVECRINLFWQGISNGKANYQFHNPGGEAALVLNGFSVQSVDTTLDGGREVRDNLLYGTQWQLLPLPNAAPNPWPPSQQPSAADLAGKLEAGKTALTAYRWSDRCPGFEQRISHVTAVFALRSLLELGWQPRAGNELTVKRLMDELGIVRERLWFMNRLIKLFGQYGWLKKNEFGWTVVEFPAVDGIENQWREIFNRFPAAIPELSLAANLGRNLTRVLRGETDPVEIVFPDGAHDIAEHLYQDSPTYRFYNQLAGQAMSLAAAQLPDRLIRVLEIGAGTGATSRYVLRHLPGDRCEYIFSDISAGFFSRARQKLADYPFVDCQVLNIELDPEEQGFQPHTFDIVIATDAIHATVDLRTSLSHIRKLLTPNGLLMLVEMDLQPDSCDLIFGLLDGWSRYGDFDLRRESPILSRPEWLRLLGETGYCNVYGISDKDGVTEASHTLFVANAPIGPSRDPAGSNGADHSQRPGTQSLNQYSGPEAAKSANSGNRWMVFEDSRGIAGFVSSEVADRNVQVISVYPGDRFEQLQNNRFAIRAGSDSDMKLLIDHLLADKTAGDIERVVHCWSIDSEPAENLNADRLQHSEEHNCHSLVNFVRQWASTETGYTPQLSVVTSGAQVTDKQVSSPSLEQAPVLGLVRTIASEMPQHRSCMIDLGPNPDSRELSALRDELLRSGLDEEIEVVLRGSARYVPRMIRVPMSGLGDQKKRRPVNAGDSVFRLEIDTPGILDRLQVRETVRREPGPGEVEIRVKAAGLNFRDVMKAMGIYPTELNEDLWLGDECAGVITRAGSGVSHFKPGDEVLAFAPGAFGSHLIAHEQRLFRKPGRLDFGESATLAAAFVTAWYALNHLGQLTKGDKVLVHTATGGVGLAAVQIAQHLGAEIIATAGTPGKRALLRTLGVRHVFDSRSLRFSDQVRAVTGGRGVDMVLNALAGQAIGQGLRCLAPFGRFLEIGKRDIYANNRIGLRCFKDNLSFIAIDMEKVFVDRPQVAARVWEDLFALFESRQLNPLPHRIFPLSDALGCFRTMAQAKHIGKLVLSMEDNLIQAFPAKAPPIQIHSGATWLIVGGFGGFGSEVALWLAGKGARHLVLMSRRGEKTPGAGKLLARLQGMGVSVLTAKGDAACREDCDRVFSQMQATMPPLKGVFQSVMHLADGLLINMTPGQFAGGMRAKVHGAWNLHEATKNQDLDVFALFSSFASVLGNPGQSNYSAANSFLDQLTHYRRSIGLPSTVINWGAFSGIGYVSERPEMMEYYDRAGIRGVTAAQATGILDQVLAQNVAQVAVVNADWARMTRSTFVRIPARFSRLLGEGKTESNDGFGKIRDALMAAKPENRMQMAIDYLASELAGVLGRSADDIDADTSLAKLGVDSLMTVELKSRIERETVVSLPVMELMNGPSLRKLASILLREMTGEAEPVLESIPATFAQTNGNSMDAGKLLERIDDLSEAEVDALLATIDSEQPSTE